MTALVVGLLALALTIYQGISRGGRMKSNQVRDLGDDVKMLLLDVNKRLDKQDAKIVDMQVKMDILEMRLEKKREEEAVGEPVKIMRRITKFGDVTSQARRQIVGGEHSLTDTEIGVLRLLQDGVKSVREVQVAIGRSREHTARLMKKLYEGGYVVRRETKPYTYELSDLGRSLLS